MGSSHAQLWYKRPTRRTYLSLLVRTLPVNCCGRVFSPALSLIFLSVSMFSFPYSARCLAHSLPWLQVYADLQFSADPSYKHMFARETSINFRSIFWYPVLGPEKILHGPRVGEWTVCGTHNWSLALTAFLANTSVWRCIFLPDQAQAVSI